MALYWLISVISVFLTTIPIRGEQDHCNSWTNGLTEDKVGNTVNIHPWRSCVNGTIHWRNPKDILKLHFIDDSHANFELCLTNKNNSEIITFRDETHQQPKQLNSLSDTPVCVQSKDHTVVIAAEVPSVQHTTAEFDYHKNYLGDGSQVVG